MMMDIDGSLIISETCLDHRCLHLTMYEAALTFRKNINPNVPKPSNAYYKPALAVLLFLKSVIFDDRY